MGMHHGVLRAMRGPTYRKFRDDCRHDLEDFGVPGIWHITVIVHKNGIKQGWHNVCAHHLEIISLLYISFDEL